MNARQRRRLHRESLRKAQGFSVHPPTEISMPMALLIRSSTRQFEFLVTPHSWPTSRRGRHLTWVLETHKRRVHGLEEVRDADVYGR